MNELHLRACAGPEWAETVRDHIIPWTTAGVDLGDHLLEVGPGPGATTDVLRVLRSAPLTAPPSRRTFPMASSAHGTSMVR